MRAFRVLFSDVPLATFIPGPSDDKFYSMFSLFVVYGFTISGSIDANSLSSGQLSVKQIVFAGLLMRCWALIGAAVFA